MPNSISRIFMLVIFVIVAFGVTIQIFGSTGNVLGSSFRFLTPLAMVLGFLSPRLAFYLLLAAGAYLDLIKRFMILDTMFTDIDLAFLLGFAPAIVAGIMFKFFMSMFTHGDPVSPREVKLFWIITFLCCFLGGASIAMEGSLRSAGGALNMVAYLYMPLIVPRLFSSVKQLRNILIATVVIYLPAALWAVHQAKFGLADFEMAYLLSGMTIEIRQLDEAVFRNMGTMVSAHALSMVASILIAALMIPVSWKTGRLSPTVWFNPLRIASIILFAWGAYYTFSRTGWICAVIAILAFVVLQSRTLTYAGFFAGIGGLIALYLSADFLLRTRVMQDGQAWLFDKFGTTAEARQALVIGTLDARLESMSNLVNEKALWTPFGLKVSGTELEVKWVHDILTETIIKIGYIPLAILVFGFFGTVLFALHQLFKMPNGPERTYATYFAALTIGMLGAGFSQGAMILYFPINMFWCLFFAMAFSSYQWWNQASLQSAKPAVTGDEKKEQVLPSCGQPRLS